MADDRKKKRQELKQPDQFVTFWSRVGTAFSQRWKVLVSLAVALAVVGVGSEMAARKSEDKRAEQSRAFARIEAIASAPLLPEQGEAPKFDDDLPHFKTDAERKQAAIKEADQFVATYSDTKLRPVIDLLKARYTASLGQNEDAAALYKKLVADGLPEDLQLIAQEGLAYALEGAGKIDEAIAAFDTLATRAAAQGDFYRDRALFNKARLLEDKGQTKEAVAIYREVVDKYPTSSLRDEVNDRMALLDEAGKTDPPAAPAPAPGGEEKAP